MKPSKNEITTRATIGIIITLRKLKMRAGGKLPKLNKKEIFSIAKDFRLPSQLIINSME